MAKKVNQVNLKGKLNMDLVEITEITKEGEFVYDFKQILQDFDGKQVTITVKEENELPIKE